MSRHIIRESQPVVPPCTAMYLLVPPCTVQVQGSTYWYVLVCTAIGITYVGTYWYVPFWGFSDGLVSSKVRTGSYQYIPTCTALYQVYRIQDDVNACQCMYIDRNVCMYIMMVLTSWCLYLFQYSILPWFWHHPRACQPVNYCWSIAVYITQVQWQWVMCYIQLLLKSLFPQVVPWHTRIFCNPFPKPIENVALSASAKWNVHIWNRLRECYSSLYTGKLKIPCPQRSNFRRLKLHLKLTWRPFAVGAIFKTPAKCAQGCRAPRAGPPTQ